MHSQIKKLVPDSIKSLFWHYYLLIKHERRNKIGKGVIFSKDFICGRNCIIGKNVIIGQNVKIGNCVRIGSHCIIEKLELGDNSCIERGVVFTGHGSGHVKIGKESYIGINNILDWSNNITIGNYVHIAGPSTGLWTHSSAKQALAGLPLNYKSKDYRPTSPIIIENNVYIGGNCTIYPGITIGHHSIVAPNSAVTKDVEPFTMVGGVSAKFIKSISLKD